MIIKKDNFSWSLIILLFLCITSNTIYLNQTTFEINKTPPPPATSDETKPLFDILKLDKKAPSNSDDEPNWDNNPFLKKEQPAIKKEKTAPIQDNFNIFEYKLSAIWKINNEYKALISGHIVKKGDKINDITISSISKDQIRVKRRKKEKSFRLGVIFYDFQI